MTIDGGPGYTNPQASERLSLAKSGLLEGNNQRDLLDMVDYLRSFGVSHYVELPQIIVCGSQSSGKSSTLESISGISFPTAEGLCTRFATEVVLRKSETTEIRAQILPGAGRSDHDKARLGAFAPRTEDLSSVPEIIEEAREVMGLSGEEGKIFSDDILRIESLSPTQPNLTLVDLPGFFGTADKNQTEEDAAMVQDLILSYMRQRRSIILAVVAADASFNTQPVTKHARDLDLSGERTLGLITKPDRLIDGSDSQAYYVDMAKNQNVHLNLGWHILRNRGFDSKRDSTEERDRREADFFGEHPWNTLSPRQLGVKSLKIRLRDVLWMQIRRELPGVKINVQTGIEEARERLAQLGQSRTSQREKHTYLNRICFRMTTLIKAAIDGVYTDKFFEAYPGQRDAFDRRLRANVQRILARYSDKMTGDGHALEVVEDDLSPVRSNRFVMRSDYLKEVAESMAQCKGRELPGTFNPLVVADLFGRQCKPWLGITLRLVEEIHEAASTIFGKLASEFCEDFARDKLMNHLIQPSLHRLRERLKAKVQELFHPHASLHPITYNKELFAEVQRIQTKRHQRTVDRISVDITGYNSTNTSQSNTYSVDLFKLLTSIASGTTPNVEEYAESLAADVAAAYYKVALAKFIDDVSVDAIETCLVQRLPEVFSPEVVWELSEEEVDTFGSEHDDVIKERKDLQEKLRILQGGLRKLDEFTVKEGAGRK